MNTVSEVGRLRRQQVVNLSMTELMILLVFMAVTFSFLAKEEGLKEIPSPQRIVELEGLIRSLNVRIEELERQNGDLRAKNEDLQKKLDRFVSSPPTPNPGVPKPTVTIPEEELQKLQREKQNLERIVAQQQREIADLRKQIGQQGGRAPGPPRCIVTSGYLLTITLLNDGSYRGVKAWADGAGEVASGLPGINLLISGERLQPSDFIVAAGQLKTWGEKQETPCRFSIAVKRETTSVDIFEQQLNVLDGLFYYRRIK